MICKNNNKFYVTEQDGIRLYVKDNIAYPSVSSVLSNPLKKTRSQSRWCSPYMSIGSAVHFFILKKYANRRLPRPTDPFYQMEPEEVTRRIDACLMMWDKLKLDIKPLAVETAIFSDSPRFAGRIDMLCLLDGKLTLLDIKTGQEYPENVIQMSGYFQGLKWKPRQLALVYLQADIDKNPEQVGRVKISTRDEVREAYDIFLDKYTEFIMPSYDESILSDI